MATQYKPLSSIRPKNDANTASLRVKCLKFDGIESYDAGSYLAKATSDTEPTFHAKNPNRRTFLKLFSLWIITLILSLLLVVMVSYYHQNGVLNPSRKSTFTVGSTILILILGLSFFEALKELAKAMRSRLAELFNAQGEEQTLIDSFDSLLKVAWLTHITPKWGLRVFCILWIGINLAAQFLAALVSLEFSIDDGNNYNTTYFTQGQVAAANLSCYVPFDWACGNFVVINEHAHSYGSSTIPGSCGPYQGIADVLKSREDLQ